MPVWAKTSPYLHTKNHNAPYDKEFYLAINMAVGTPGIYFNQTAFPERPWDTDYPLAVN